MPADEFDIIARLFAPLAASEGARGLRDDAALYAGKIMTTDAIVEGVHFLSDDPIETVAQKALRVNLSDLAAKGARAEAVLLTLIWPQSRASAEIEGFARGLAADLGAFGVALIGGDTTSTPGPLTISITAFGAPLGPRTPARADAKPGQDLWVTGEIGDAMIGLEALSGPPSVVLSLEDQDAVIARYRVPQPRLAFAKAIADYAAAAMDVSDGLAQDAGKIAAASGVRLVIDVAAAPVSAAAESWIAAGGERAALLGGGDDYEILFTADAGLRDAIVAAGAETKLRVTRIGRVEAGAGVVDETGAPLVHGYRHQLGA